LKIPCNEPRALVEAEISPGPLKKHREAIPETDQKNDVDK
jgi:hypothetical protein